MATDDTRAGLRVLGDLRIFQAIHNDLKLRHEVVTDANGIQRYAYVYDGADPYELEDQHFPTLLTALDRYSSERAIEELWKVREQVTLHHYDTTAGRRIDEFLEQRIAALTPKAKGETDHE